MLIQYIDWALDQGALTFAYQFGDSFLTDKNVTEEVQKVLPAFMDVLKMNSYEFDLKKEDGKLLIQSNSLIDFSIQLFTGGENKVILLPARQLTEALLEIRDEIIVVKIVGGRQSNTKHFLVSEIKQQPKLFHMKNNVI